MRAVKVAVNATQRVGVMVQNRPVQLARLSVGCAWVLAGFDGSAASKEFCAEILGRKWELQGSGSVPSTKPRRFQVTLVPLIVYVSHDVIQHGELRTTCSAGRPVRYGSYKHTTQSDIGENGTSRAAQYV